MDVTELGIVTEVKPVQPEKAYSPMDTTVLGMTVVLQPVINVLSAVRIMALQLSRLSYTGLPDSTTMEVNPVQPLNTLLPIDVTELGIVMEVRLVQPLKA